MVCCPTAIRRRTCRSGRLFALLAAKHDVHREVCGSGFHHAVAEGREIQALEHRLAPSERDRRKREVQFIDQTGLQILANCRDPASNLDVTCSSGVACALERGVDPVRNEVERGAGPPLRSARGHGASGQTSEHEKADCLPTSRSSYRPAISHARDRTCSGQG